MPKPHAPKTGWDKESLSVVIKAARKRVDAQIKTSERHIQETCSDFLALDGWRRIRTDLPHLRGLGVQEKGIADDFYLRYHSFVGSAAGTPPEEHYKHRMELGDCDAQVLIVEWKCKTGKAFAEQLAWHENERARGALTWIAGVDFEASIEGFQAKYRKSGLARKVR